MLSYLPISLSGGLVGFIAVTMVLVQLVAALVLLIGGPVLVAWILLRGRSRPRKDAGKAASGPHDDYSRPVPI